MNYPNVSAEAMFMLGMAAGAVGFRPAVVRPQNGVKVFLTFANENETVERTAFSLEEAFELIEGFEKIYYFLQTCKVEVADDATFTWPTSRGGTEVLHWIAG